ncbi:hypothetical protein ACJRO7_015064 [Eucalyptus globulus]|uniref:RNA polymerase Rpb5 N-terminal domain-containing protein n=1 Tax=Eucalyptus globulus TaxID=34317 RepID=A0ABD3L396_EUCGL
MAATAMDVDDPGMAEAVNGQAQLRCMRCYVDESSIESHRYYLAWRTLLEMLRDRGYAIPSSDIDVSLAEFRAAHSQSPDIDCLRISNSLRSDPSKQVLAYFCNPGPVKVNSIRYISGQIANKDGMSGLILVLQGEMTNQALKELDLFPFKVVVFQKTTEVFIDSEREDFLSDELRMRSLSRFLIRSVKPRFSSGTTDRHEDGWGWRCVAACSHWTATPSKTSAMGSLLERPKVVTLELRARVRERRLAEVEVEAKELR